jgi:two-component system response regulator PilR (NtrC family)
MLVERGIGDLSAESLRARIRWVLFARVLIVTVFLGATALTHTSLESDPGFPLRGVAGLIVGAYAFSIFSAWLLGRVRHLHAFASAQIAADVLLISVSVLLTGGLRSPMAVWYNLAVLGGSMLLLRRGAYATAAFASIIYGVLMNAIYYGALPEGWVFAPGPVGTDFGVVNQIAANITSFFSIAFLSSFLVERVASTERELERSQETLHRVEALQQTLVQSLESGVLTTDADGRIQSANPAIETILGLRPPDLVGKPIGEVLPVLRPPFGSKPMIDASPFPIELSRRADPGAAEQILRCSSVPLTDTYQNLIGRLFILQDVSEIKRLEQEAARESAPPHEVQIPPPPPVAGLLGQSRATAQVAQIIRKAAPTGATVLITGESGTGKEVAARAIHSLSPRRDKPMVVVNCAAIPENLIESELFGHVRGAFTGAVSDRRGLFRAADGGTIFLDEVGDLPLLLQVKLLRVLQERSFLPVGSQTQVAVDVRIVAATNRNLESDVRSGAFREDLFYRLNVIRIEVPPLRARAEDLPVLIDHFVTRFSEAAKRPPAKLAPQAFRRLLAYDYPGNIRELENVIEHAVALSSGDTIQEEDLPASVLNGAGSADPSSPAPAPEQVISTAPSVDTVDWMKDGHSNLDAELETLERRYLQEALRRAGGVRKRAAEILGINYRSLRHRLAKYGFGDADSKELQD